MTYQTLYRKYRPQRFAGVVGQRHVVRTLENAVASGKLSHAYLFAGPRGTGKTTTARILAKSLNCQNRDGVEPCNECPNCLDVNRGVAFDVYEVDAASNRGIDDIRALSERAQQAASDPTRYRVFIIDEVHQLSRDGASAFLKTLEEPPANVVFVLATTDADKMIPTILSRCQRFEFRPVATDALARHLADVCAAEGIDADTAALEAIARRARGGVRDALSALEQARALCGDRIGAADVVELFGGLDLDDLAGPVEAVSAEDAAGALRQVEALVERGIDIRVLARELAEYVRKVFLAAAAPAARDVVDAGEDEYGRIRAQAQALGPGRALRALTVLGDMLARLPQSLSPRIDLEAALVRLCRPGVDGDVSGLAARVERLEGRLAAGVVPRPEVTPGSTPAPVPPARPPAPAAAPGRGVAAEAPRDAAATETAPVVPSRPAPVAATPSEAAPLDLDAVERLWPAVLSAVKDRSRRVGAYFASTVPVAVDAATVTVQFPHAFSLEHATATEESALFTEAAQEVVGRPLRVSGVLGDGPASATAAPSPSSETPPDEPSEADPFEDVVVDAGGGGEGGSARTGGLPGVLDLVTSTLDAEVVEERES